MTKVCGRLIVLFACLIVAGCATTKGPMGERDPLERYNRAVFKFNDTLDRAILKPVAKGYRAALPEAFNLAISNFFSNLGDVGVAFNNLLQLKIIDASSDVGRLVINTTLGIGGLFDVASGFGLRKHEEDFGQTLGYWGVPSGPFLMLPFFGPSTFRDAPSRVADGYLDPVVYVSGDVRRLSLIGSRVVDTRADLLSAEETLNEIALDRYIAIRNAFLDRREFLVYDGEPPPDEDLIEQIESLDLEP